MTLFRAVKTEVKRVIVDQYPNQYTHLAGNFFKLFF